MIWEGQPMFPFYHNIRFWTRAVQSVQSAVSQLQYANGQQAVASPMLMAAKLSHFLITNVRQLALFHFKRISLTAIRFAKLGIVRWASVFQPIVVDRFLTRKIHHGKEEMQCTAKKKDFFMPVRETSSLYELASMIIFSSSSSRIYSASQG